MGAHADEVGEEFALRAALRKKSLDYGNEALRRLNTDILKHGMRPQYVRVHLVVELDSKRVRDHVQKFHRLRREIARERV